MVLICDEAQVEALLVQLEIVLILTQDEAQVEDHFGPFGDNANLEQNSCTDLRQTYHRLGNHFERTRWNCSEISFRSVLETVLILTQLRSTVYAEHTLGSEIILDAYDGTAW
jgi:hypothetical protein